MILELLYYIDKDLSGLRKKGITCLSLMRVEVKELFLLEI